MSASWEAGGVRVHWSANGEADLAGYRVYRAITSGGAFTQVNGSTVVVNDYLDVAAPDSASLWYQVSAVDQSGNESPRSAIYRLWRDGAPATSVTLQAVYPNPSSLTTPVTIPIAIPPSGPTEGRLDILDGAGALLHLGGTTQVVQFVRRP
jgi:hypothetical protein